MRKVIVAVMPAAGLAAALCLLAQGANGQGAPAPSPEQQAIRAATQAEWKRQMQELGLPAIRPGADTKNPASPYAVNNDAAKANLYPLPDPLAMADGKRVSTLKQWETVRRPQVLRLVTEELYGAAPKTLPRIGWHVDSVERGEVQGVAAVTKHLTAHADNFGEPAITVYI